MAEYLLRHTGRLLVPTIALHTIASSPLPLISSFLLILRTTVTMARTKDPQKVPRPCNPFFQFRRVIIGELQSTKPQRNLSKEISRMWKALSPEEKAIYIAMAEDEKLWHKEMYPDYQYRPKRNKKKAVVKIEDGSLSPPSTSRSSSLASSSASTPAPSTPDITTTILPAGLSSSHVAFDCNSKSGEGFVLNHPVPPNVHANTGVCQSRTRLFSGHADRVLAH